MESTQLKEFIRFGIVGCVATIIHYAIYLLLNLWLNTTIAYSIGYFVSFIGNFYFSNRYTFRTKPSFKKSLGFGLSHIINYLLQVGLLYAFITLGMKEQYAPIPVYAIAVPVNFFLVRYALKCSPGHTCSE